LAATTTMSGMDGCLRRWLSTSRIVKPLKVDTLNLWDVSGRLRRNEFRKFCGI